MAKSHNQKAKILYLEQMLRETGEDHVVTMQDILAGLMEYGIHAERKSIYDDIEALRDFGLDVKYKRGRPGGYYLAGQSFSEPEKQPLPEKPVQPEKKAVQKKAAEEPVWIPEKDGIVEEKKMKLLCDYAKEKEVKAYFGKYAEYKEKGLSYFTVTAPQMSGPQFFGWLTAMGKDVHILKPKKTAAAYREYLKALVKEYKGV